MVLLFACATEKSVFEREMERHHEELKDTRRVAGELRLSCDVTDAEVYVDGVLQGACGDFVDRAVMNLSLGPHRVEVKKPGFVPWVVQVESSDTRTQLKVNLAPMN